MTTSRLICNALILCVVISAHRSQADQPSALLDAVSIFRNGTPAQIAETVQSLSADALSHEEIVGQLVFLLNDDRPVRIVRDDTTVSEELYQVALDKLHELPPEATVWIARRLPNLKSDTERTAAMSVIKDIATVNPEAYQFILPYCIKPNAKAASLRSSAISALSVVGGDSNATIAQLGKFLNDPNPTVRWTVLDLLSQHKDRIQPFIPKIISMLDDKSYVQRPISSHASYAVLLRYRVAHMLLEVGPTANDAIPKLTQISQSRDYAYMRVWAAAALCTISTTLPLDALDILRKDLLFELDNEDVRNSAPGAIAEIGPRAAVLLDDLERAKSHRSHSVRMELPEAFFAVDPDSALRRTLSLIDDENKYVIGNVIESFDKHKLSTPEVIHGYIRVLDRYQGEWDDPAHYAVKALSNLGDVSKSALPALQRLASHPKLVDDIKPDVDELIKLLQ